MHLPLTDLHVHTCFSCDSDAEMEAFCHRAVALGLRQLAFTEHVDFVPADVGFGFFRPAVYLAEIERCRALFAGRVTVLSGMELGEPHRYRPEANALLAAHEWDVVISSLHWVQGQMVFDPDYFRQRPGDRAYRDYFVELAEMCWAGGFDALGHFDVVKRCGFEVNGGYDEACLEGVIRPVLEALIAHRIALEINTATLRLPVGQASPTLPVLRWYREMGGELVTIGSDAHSVANLAAGWETAVGLARAAGFTHLTSFRRREPVLIPLEGA